MDPIRRPVHPSVQRRRDLASSLNYPADLREKFGKFTYGQRTVLKIICGEVCGHGACTLTKDAIADLSCVSYPVVKTTIRVNLVNSDCPRTGGLLAIADRFAELLGAQRALLADHVPIWRKKERRTRRSVLTEGDLGGFILMRRTSDFAPSVRFAAKDKKLAAQKPALLSQDRCARHLPFAKSSF
jgi:hypothetical protein